MRALCRHCERNVLSRPRGLCFTCYGTPGVREMYPVSDSKYNRRGTSNFYGPAKLPEPTTTLPGTPEREAVLTERASRGQALYHPDDATHEGN